MNIEPKIVELPAKKLIGLHQTMSLSENKTADLWKNFMQQRHHIKHAVNNELISLQIYDSHYFKNFQVSHVFEKWACSAVAHFEEIPEGFDTLLLAEGLYAVFHYKGLSTNSAIFQYIYSTWLPSSSYDLDHRPHFEVLGDKYKNNSIDSEEEICVPVKPK